MTVFVPNGENQGVTATWLLHTADENDIDRRSIKTTRGGFNVPDALAAALGLAEPVVMVPEIPVEARYIDPPDGWYETPLPKVDVQIDAEGRVVLTAEAAEREIAEGTVVVEPTQNSADFSDEPVVTAVQVVTTITEVDREVVRAWAKDQGLFVAEKGALKKSVLEAYAASHSRD